MFTPEEAHLPRSCAESLSLVVGLRRRQCTARWWTGVDEGRRRRRLRDRDPFREDHHIRRNSSFEVIYRGLYSWHISHHPAAGAARRRRPKNISRVFSSFLKVRKMQIFISRDFSSAQGLASSLRPCIHFQQYSGPTSSRERRQHHLGVSRGRPET